MLYPVPLVKFMTPGNWPLGCRDAGNSASIRPRPWQLSCEGGRLHSNRRAEFELLAGGSRTLVDIPETGALRNGGIYRRESLKTEVLVTGGAGYIGSHTCKALAESGYRPLAYDNLSEGHERDVKWGRLIIGDLVDAGLLLSTLKESRPEAVLHLAGRGYVGESLRDPEKYFQNNVVATANLLRSMRIVGVDKIIFSSSCSTYGIPNTVPIPSSHPQEPISPYGLTKFMAEQMIKEFARAYGIRYSILRYFNAAGADPEGELSEAHDPEYHLIPLAMDSAFGRRGPIEVFGTDYSTPDGTCVRDYIHVSDLAASNVRALERLRSGTSAEIRNLGTGDGTSVLEVTQAVGRMTGREVPLIFRDRRAGDPPILVAERLDEPLRFGTIEDILETLILKDTRG